MVCGIWYVKSSFFPYLKLKTIFFWITISRGTPVEKPCSRALYKPKTSTRTSRVLLRAIFGSIVAIYMHAV
jgi:hypothetical protein